jgi:hypothetical protein
MTIYESPIPLPAHPGLTVTAHDGASYVLSDGRTLWAPAPTEDAEPAAIAAEVEALLASPPPAPPTSEPRELSKLTLTRRLREMGKEDAFWAVLDASPVLRREWLSSQVVRTDDPMFTANAEDLKDAIGLSDVDFAALLAP